MTIVFVLSEILILGLVVNHYVVWMAGFVISTGNTAVIDNVTARHVNMHSLSKC